MSSKRGGGQTTPIGTEVRDPRSAVGAPKLGYYKQESNFFTTARGSLRTSLSQILTTW